MQIAVLGGEDGPVAAAGDFALTDLRYVCDSVASGVPKRASNDRLVASRIIEAAAPPSLPL